MADKVWLVGRVKRNLTDWGIEGIFDNKDQALAACKTWRYFIAHIPMNEVLPDRVFANSYYPLATWDRRTKAAQKKGD